MNRWGSVNYHNSLRDSDLLRADEAAKVLGVSVSWLRRNLAPTEWHHCNLKYGGSAKAFFWSENALWQFLEFAKTENEDELVEYPEKPSGSTRKEREWDLALFVKELRAAKEKYDRRGKK